ncbi:MAG: energy-coupling factor transporter transmembrane protein EcfT [Chloroflexi bacterium]|nr:energy-coupling factor transporter transmembrane protein EcfT [Chloroflexota bacterium]
MKWKRRKLYISTDLEETSPLRKFDPRTKLFLSLCASVVVMLPLQRLFIFLGLYIIFIIWARLFSHFLKQMDKIKWILIILFLVDWLVVSLQLAAEVTLRLSVLTSVFTVLFATTTPSELGLALESLGFPYRFAFSINLAFQSLGMLEQEWQAIWEAQKSRGVLFDIMNFRTLFTKVGDLVSLTVPAIVLATKHAWVITESATARGFDSPMRKPFHQLSYSACDWVVSIISAGLVSMLILWR